MSADTHSRRDPRVDWPNICGIVKTRPMLDALPLAIAFAASATRPHLCSRTVQPSDACDAAFTLPMAPRAVLFPCPCRQADAWLVASAAHPLTQAPVSCGKRTRCDGHRFVFGIAKERGITMETTHDRLTSVESTKHTLQSRASAWHSPGALAAFVGFIVVFSVLMSGYTFFDAGQEK